ncbi:hypothetical protein [Flexibacter flexilis]|uniref:hypothetical protein n=1 Tax=Flexibacter flexilis TaxID=998 RepID=UPI001C86D98B|nr:hypothetical protein [Flexibacter flexilis]
MKISFLGLIGLGIGLLGCQKQAEQAAQSPSIDPQQVVAKVGTKTLTYAELADVLAPNISHTDSVQRITRYAEAWVRQQLWEKEANNQGFTPTDLEEKVEQYRRDLLVEAFKQKYITEHLDTNLTEADINKFYTENQTNFLLRSPIVQAQWVQLPKGTPKQDKAMDWFKSRKEADRQEFRSYCIRFATTYQLQDTVWTNFEELVRGTPFSEITNKNDFVSKNTFSQKQDEDFVYLLKISAYKISGQTAPLAYVQAQVKGIILNQRKTELLNTLSNDVYKQAQKQQEFEILVKP